MRIHIVAAAVGVLLAGFCVAGEQHTGGSELTHIVAQPLAEALSALAKQRKFQVLYRSDLVRGLRTRGAMGELTTDEALAQLLEGTGLSFRFLDDDTVTIVPSSAVAAQKTGNASSSDKSGARAASKGKAGDRSATGRSRTGRAGPRASVSDGDDPGGSASASDGNPAANYAELKEVIVTGSHIAGVRPISPVTTITSEDIRNSGLPDAASVIRALPQSFSGGLNPGVIAAGGINYGGSPLNTSTANLRGIGAGYTLTLLDGHRLADVGTSGSVDISSIPTAAIKEIQIQTGGASAIYGADAVAGVVNIVLRKNFEGASTDAYVGGTTGGGLVQRYSQLAGRTFEHGMAGIMIGYQFQSSDEIDASQRAVSHAAGAYTLQPQQKSHSAFVSAHFDMPWVTTHLEGVYSHRTNLDRTNLVSAVNMDQGLEDQFALEGGLDVRVPGGRTVGLDTTWSGDSSADTEYSPSSPLVSRVENQDRLVEFSLTEQGTAFRLPGHRTVRSAMGVGIRRSYIDSSSIKWGRRVEHAYAEVNIPVFPSSTHRSGLERLTLSAAGRFEHYSDFGSTSVPKISLAWSPVRSVTLSGSWGRSFKPPTLLQLHLGQAVVRYPGSMFGFSPAREVLLLQGSNPRLKPQTASEWTGGIQWRPRMHPFVGVNASISYFDMRFVNGVNVPIYYLNYPQVANNPLYAPFVLAEPSAAAQDAVIAGAQYNFNFFNLPVDPGAVQAIVYDTYDNISLQDINGVDGHLAYHKETGVGEVLLDVDASWERFDQQLLHGAGLQQIAGTIFNPPSFKSRMMLGWNRARWGATLFANYVSGERNTAVNPTDHVGSWVTFDGQLRWSNSEFSIRLSAQNLLNRAPPSIPAVATDPTGLGFDPDNYSALGRFMSLEASTAW